MPPEIEFASPEDRGDIVANAPVDKQEVIVPPVEEAKVEEVKVEEAKVEEQPRDEGGKFAKKERPAPADDEVRIPKSRFDEQVAKERERAEALERRLAEMEAKLNAQQPKEEPKPDPVATKLEGLEAKLEELNDKRDGFLVDGNAEQAAAMRKEIRALEREIREAELQRVRADAEQMAARKLETQTEAQRIDTVVANLEDQFSVLKKGSDNYDPRMVNFVLVEQQRLISEEGLAPHEALRKAGVETMELFGHKAAKAGDKPAAEGEEKPDIAAKRKADALAKAVDAATRQPSGMKDVGMDSDKAGKDTVNLDPNKLTDKEFASLSETEKAKMRGDFLEG